MMVYQNTLYRLKPEHAVLAVETLVALDGRVHKLGQQDFPALLRAIRYMGDEGQVTLTTHKAGQVIQWSVELYVSGWLLSDDYGAFLSVWGDYNGN